MISQEVDLPFLTFLVVTFIINQSAAAIALPKNVTIPAVIVFGDSVMDPGNNNQINTMVKCNFQPYGRDFTGKKPAGRFSNGRVPSDMLAEILGIKKNLPAYLDPNLKIEDLLTGISFASGGSGYDRMTPQIVGVMTLQTLTSTLFRSPYYDIPAYTDLLAQSASQFFQELYAQGARRIGVVGIPAIGCMPQLRTTSGDMNRGCSDVDNEAAILFNSKLSFHLDSLTKKLPDAN